MPPYVKKMVTEGDSLCVRLFKRQNPEVNATQKELQVRHLYLRRAPEYEYCFIVIILLLLPRSSDQLYQKRNKIGFTQI
jgi:hypothetical protein